MLLEAREVGDVLQYINSRGRHVRVKPEPQVRVSKSRIDGLKVHMQSKTVSRESSVLSCQEPYQQSAWVLRPMLDNFLCKISPPTTDSG